MNTIASVWITQSFKKLFLFWLFYLCISLFLILHFYLNYKSIEIERKKLLQVHEHPPFVECENMTCADILNVYLNVVAYLENA